MRVSTQRRAALWIAIGLAAAGCQDLTDYEHATIDAWLNCDECINGERQAVKALGSRAVPRLTDALEDGPPGDRLENMRKKFAAVFAAIEAARGPGITGISRSEYVGRAEQNYVANYRQRAAIALKDIGGPQAQATLRDAARTAALRPFVPAGVRSASIDPTFRGTIEPRSPAYGDTVVVRPPASEPFTGDELVAVDSLGCSANDPPLAVTIDRLTFLIAGDTGVHSLVICNVGVTTGSQRATIVIRSIYDANDRRTASCTDVACIASRAPNLLPAAVAQSKPAIAKLSLWRTGAIVDTADFFRFEPAVATVVQARLSWRSSANLDLLWSTCTGAPAGTADGATDSDNPEVTTQTVPAGACWLLRVYLRGRSAPLTHALLEIVQP